jgi:hypothetical protein
MATRKKKKTFSFLVLEEAFGFLLEKKRRKASRDATHNPKSSSFGKHLETS